MNVKLSLVLIALLVWPMALLAKDPIYTGFFSNTALQGYDAVSYFQGAGEPVKGDKQWQYEWRGAQWYFSSQSNLALFKANPVRYAPQYGGYCAWATAQGKLVKADPLIYTIQDDKLYVNYDEKVDRKWQIERDKFIKQADRVYPALVEFE